MSTEQNASLAEGIRLLQAGNLPDAREQLVQAIQGNPSNGRAYGYLGIVLARLGDPTGGLNALQEAVRLQPNDPGALYNLAVALVQVQRTADAKLALEHVLVMDPNHTKARAALQSLNNTTMQIPTQPSASTPYVAPPSAPAGMYAPAQPQPLDGSPGAGLAGGMSAPPPSSPGSYSPPSPGKYAPPSLYDGSPYGGSPYSTPPPPGSGMHYTQAPMAQHAAPSSGTRIQRGLGWGALYGQVFTGWTAFRLLVLNGSYASSQTEVSTGFAQLELGPKLLISAIVFAVLGAIVGLIIGSTDATDDAGGIIGIVSGFAMVGLQLLAGIRSGIGLIFGIFFAISVGRYVGISIANKIHQPAGP